MACYCYCYCYSYFFKPFLQTITYPPEVIKTDIKQVEYSFEGTFDYPIDSYDFFNRFLPSIYCPYIRIGKYHKLLSGFRLNTDKWYVEFIENKLEDDENTLQLFVYGKDNLNEMNIENIGAVHVKAKKAAFDAATKFLNERGGKDNYPCGFAWVTVSEKGSTKMGRALKAIGFRKAYNGGLELWDPSGLLVQNVYTLEAGAEAYAEVLRNELGVTAYAGSRWD
jgi:hypothetical protein